MCSTTPSNRFLSWYGFALTQIKKYAPGNYFGNEEGFDATTKAFSAKVSSFKASLLEIQKKKIKQNTYYEPELLKAIRDISDQKQGSMQYEKSLAVQRIKLRKEERQQMYQKMNFDLMQLSSQRLKKGGANVFHGMNSEPFSLRVLNSKPKRVKLEPNLKRSFQLETKQTSLKSIPEVHDRPLNHVAAQDSSAKSHRMINYRSLSESKLVDRSTDLLDYCKRIIPDLQNGKEKCQDESIPVVPSIQSQLYCLPQIQPSASNSRKNKAQTSRSQLDLLPLPRMAQKKPEKKEIGVCSSRGIENQELSSSSVKYKIVSLSLDKVDPEKQGRKAQKGKMNPFDLFPKLKVLFKDSVNLIAAKSERGAAPLRSERLISGSRAEEGSNSTLTPSVPSVLLQAA